MGYTHYFEQKKATNQEQWNKFQKDAEVLINFAQTNLGIVLMSNSEDGVMINDKRINLNGDETQGLDHETFYLEHDLREFNFCKTARKPYDLVVCSLLLLAHYHLPGHYDIGSDGDFSEWQDSMKLNAQLFKYAYELPESVDDSEEVKEFEKTLV